MDDCILTLVYWLALVFQVGVSLFSPGCPRTCYVDQASFELSVSPWNLGIKGLGLPSLQMPVADILCLICNSKAFVLPSPPPCPADQRFIYSLPALGFFF